MPDPTWVKLDLARLRDRGPRDVMTAVFEALVAYRPDASTADLAAFLGVTPRAVRSYRIRASERTSQAAAKRNGRSAQNGTDVPPKRNARSAPNGTSVPLSHYKGDVKDRERQRQNPPSPSLRDQIKTATDGRQKVALLVAGYMARCTNAKVQPREFQGRLLEDLREKRYTPEDAARYLQDTPAVTGWPSEFAGQVTSWIETLSQRAAKGREVAAWAAWRRRLRTVTAGEPCWRSGAEGDLDGSVIEVDAETAFVTVRLRGDRLDVRTPADGAAWTFEVEAMPLFAAAAGAETGEETP